MYGFRSVFSYSGVTSCWVSGDVDLVELLLVAAGDVETNPGPVKAGRLIKNTSGEICGSNANAPLKCS